VIHRPWPLRAARAVQLVVAGVVLVLLTTSLFLQWPWPPDSWGPSVALVGPAIWLTSLALIALDRDRHPTVEPTGRRLTPQLATAAWPRAFRLGRVHAMRSRRWTRRLRRSSRLVVQPGRLWIDRPGAPLPEPFGFGPAAAWLVRYPPEVRLVQPLVGRHGEPGLVVHQADGTPLLVATDEPREEVLTELAAAGFAVDGDEQVVTRHWARTRPQRMHANPGPRLG
jgi:hypothetical protein